MAATMAQMPSTPGAGPSSNPISRTTSTSSHVSSDELVSDSEEEWLGPFRIELKLQQDQRRRELLEGVEDKYRAQAASLAAKYSRSSVSTGGAPDAAYQAAKAQLDRYYEQQKQRVQRLLDEEALALIEHERGIRKLSMGGQIDPNEATQLIQEQEELLKRFQAQRSESTNVSGNEKKSQPSTSPQTARWPVPPARPISAQKSNTSQASSVTRDRRGSEVVPQPKPNLTDDLFSKRSQPSRQQSSRSARYAPWGDEFPSSFDIHEEPDEVSEPDSSSGDEEDGRETDEREGENSESEGESDDSQDGISILGDFMYSAEHNFVRTAPVDIVRGGVGAHQPSTRGRSRTAGRTLPVISNPYSSAITTPLRQPHKETSKNSDSDHRLWKPSRENIRQPPLIRRPSFIDPSLREESIQEMQSHSGYQNIRAQQAGGISRGAPGTSASPPTQAMPSTSFGASSAAAFSQQRQTEARPQIWRPPESRSSVPVPVLSNEHVTVSSARNTGWATPTTSPTASVHSSRKRNDSDTSTGSPARRPSQSHSQSFIQLSPVSKASLPVNTPGLSAARRSPIPASDSYLSAPSPPISSPLSTSVNRRSPLPPRTSSPPPLPISIGGSSLSRQPTEIIDPSPPSERRKASKSYSRASAKSLTSGDPPEAELSFGSSASGSFNERMCGSPSTSSLSERLARQREQDLQADRKQKEREEALEREAEELRQRDILHRKREAELTAGSCKNDGNTTEQERRKREQVLQEQRIEQEKENRVLREQLEAAKLARDDAAFEEQKSILVQQRQREADRRKSLEHDLAAKEEELSRHKREMEEWKRRRQEDEIAERTRQLELLKKKEAALEQQQKVLEEEREREVSAQRRKIEELNMKIEELKRKTQELTEEQQRREDKRREEEERIAEQRRKEEQLRAEEEALKQKAWQIHQREEELARRKKEDELRAKEEALARQRRELQAREEELARREEEDAQRRKEEQMQKEKEMILRRQREDEDRKRNEERVMRKLAQEREREEREKEAQLREMREREEIEREMREKERERLVQEDDRQRQFQLRAEEMERRRREEHDRLTAEEIKDQEELLRFYEQRKQTEEARKRGPQRTGSTSSYSSSIPAASSSYSAAFGTFPSGRATSSASSVHSSASQRSSASSASASSAAPTDYSHYSHASTASSASSASTRPTTASPGSSASGRTATGESRKPRAVPKAETYGGARMYGASGTSPSSAGPRTGSTSSSIPSEEEMRRRQEEYIQEQQRRFEQQKLHEERERAARAAGDATAQVVERWITYDREWNKLSVKDVLFFHSIPWPLLKQPTEDVHLRKEGESVIEEAQVTAFVTHPTLLKHLNLSDRDMAKHLLRRYHTDRFANGVLVKVPDDHKAGVRKAADDVASALNKIKDGIGLF